MKARVKYYDNLFDACEDKSASTVTIYGDTRSDLMKSVFALSEKYVVSNVFLDESKKEDQAS